MAHSGFVHLPVHSASILRVELNSVHADIALAGIGVVSKNERKGDEWTAVLGPAGKDGEFCEVNVVAGEDDFLAEWVFGAGFWRCVFEFEELGEKFEGFGGAFGDFWLKEGGDAGGMLFEVITAEGHGHPFSGAHCVYGDGVGVILGALGPGLWVDARVVHYRRHGIWSAESVGWANGILEKESGSTGFHNSIGDFRDFEVGGEGFGDDLEFVFGFEGVQKVLVIAVGHRVVYDSTR